MPPDVAASYGVELVRWPRQRTLRARLARAGVPRLLLVDADAPLPDDLAIDEDWLRWPADGDEVESRARHLCRTIVARRTERPWLEPNGVLHRGTATVVLPASEAVVAEALLRARGGVVARAELEALLWPGGSPPGPRALDGVMYRLRRRLRAVGLVVRTARRRGFSVTA